MGSEGGEVSKPTYQRSLVVQPGCVRKSAELVKGHPMRIEQDLADHQSAITLEDAPQLAQCAPFVGDLAKRGDQVSGVEVIVRIRQRLGVTLRRYDVRDTQRACSAHGAVEHLLLDVQDFKGASRLQPTGGMEGVVAGARSDLEHPLAGLGREYLAQSGAGYGEVRKVKGEAQAVRARRGILALVRDVREKARSAHHYEPTRDEGCSSLPHTPLPTHPRGRGCAYLRASAHRSLVFPAPPLHHLPGRCTLGHVFPLFSYVAGHVDQGEQLLAESV